MKLQSRTIISGAIFIAIYTGFQGGRYFLANRIQEIGILCALSLFLYGAVMTALKIKKTEIRWNWWFFSTIFFVAYTFILPGYLFSVNNGVAMMPSVFASREFLITMLCPGLYFLYRLGFSVEDMEHIFLVALVSLVLSYVFHYVRMDLKAAYFSPDPTVSGLITFDEWRGFRLKTPSVAFYLLSVMAPMLAYYSSEKSKKIAWILMCCLLIWIWLLVSQRSMAASLIAATLAYHMMFAEKPRLGLFFMILPGASVGIWMGVESSIEHLSQLDPENDGVRFKSYTIAWESMKRYPLLGFGMQSSATLTEQKIFWYKFFSADIGIIGIAYKFGLVGAFIYLVFSYFLLQRLLNTLWLYKKKFNRVNFSMLALFIVCLGFTLNIALTPVYTYIPGLTAASFGIAITSIWLEKLRKLPG